MGHWCAWLLFWHVIHGCLNNQALADTRSTAAWIKSLYCSYLRVNLLSGRTNEWRAIIKEYDIYLVRWGSFNTATVPYCTDISCLTAPNKPPTPLQNDQDLAVPPKMAATGSHAHSYSTVLVTCLTAPLPFQR